MSGAARHDVAIIGMAGRFPGARDIDTFWRNLTAGVESRTVFTDDELKAEGYTPMMLQSPKVVRSGFILDDVEMFDAAFFGLNPREAELLDPQHRLFLECAWQAIENAGYDPDTFPGNIGVFGGATLSSYLTQNVFRNPEVVKAVGARQAVYGSVPDYMVTRVAYKLNLKGPAYFVQSACSTSLVAVYLACRSLAAGECDIVLAGGVSVAVPQRSPYVYEEGGMLSPDGICRTFDSRARGTVFGSGVGMVVLKRLADAIADGDTIHAVIKGSAANNDGSLKVGFTAPGVVGQSRVIRDALRNADTPADTISYVEAHGTGTELGDPIEIAALTRAYREMTDRRQFCAVGSVKPNIGHLDAAAGVSSLIKTVLALKHRQLPPTINFEALNPKIDLEESPFFINATLQPWTANGTPRRAGVSSFGFGGTNAHIIVEEAPAAPAAAPSRRQQLLLVSARTETALENATTQLADFLQRQPGTSLADAAYTLAAGRRKFAQRRAIVCADRQEAIDLVSERDPRRVFTGTAKDRSVVFMFPGQGSQYVNMARGLYQDEPSFREELDACAELLREPLGCDIRELLFPAEPSPEASERLTRTSIAQSALFVIEYSLARLLMSWGVTPAAMIGHSLGELVAACLAGVFTLEDALRLVALRGQLMEQMPHGTMAAVPLAADRVMRELEPELSLAAANSPMLSVISGTPEAVDRFVAARSREGVECRRLHTSHAFHSALMEAAVPAFVEAVRASKLQAPALPFVSNLTGTWITAEQATDPEYWGQHIRRPVRFGDGVATLLEDPNRILVELGPGNTLSGLVRQQARTGDHVVISTLRHPQEEIADAVTVLGALGRLWTSGGVVDWAAFYGAERRRRVPLPTYPFEKQRFWVEPETSVSVKKILGAVAQMLNDDLSRWFHIVSWKRSMAPTPSLAAGRASTDPCLVFDDGSAATAGLMRRLAATNRQVLRVRPGDGFASDGDLWTINPASAADYVALIQDLRKRGTLPEDIVHLWNVTGSPDAAPDDAAMRRYEQRGFYSLLYLVQALAQSGQPAPSRIAVLSDGVYEVGGTEALIAEKATLVGPCRVAPQEFPQIGCRHIDLGITEVAALSDDQIDVIVADALTPSAEASIAYRGGRRFVQGYERAVLDAIDDQKNPRLQTAGVYLVTGGMGGIGLVIAEHLAARFGARLILTGRRGLPPRDEWPALLAADPQAATARRIAAVQKLEALGAEVMIGEADATDEAAMQAVVAAARERFGAINGVIHAAGIAGGGLIQLKKPEAARAVLAPKVDGARILARIFADQKLDFMVLCSSLAGIVGGVGQVDYCAANAYLDSFASQFASQTGAFTVSVNWNAWREVGMAVDTSVPEDLREALRAGMMAAGITNAEGVDAFCRILGRSTERQVAVSPNDLGLQIEAAMLPDDQKQLRPAAAAEQASAAAPARSASAHPRPSLQNPYVAPRNEAETQICAVWGELLGIDQVGIHDNFFDLGGHSLLAIRVMQRVNEVLKTEIPVARLYDGLTVAFLAGLVDKAEEPAAEAPPEDDALAERRARVRKQREQSRRQGPIRELTRT
jgi:acyl transferase domain-containing protein